MRAGDAEHVAERAENDIRPARDRRAPVDHLERCDADRAAGAVHQLDLRGQEAVDPVLDDGVGLPPADLHDRPGPGHGPRNGRWLLLARFAVAVFIDVFIMAAYLQLGLLHLRRIQFGKLVHSLEQLVDAQRAATSIDHADSKADWGQNALGTV